MKKNPLIIDTPCITKILMECQLTYHVPDMHEVRMLKMSMLTCFHAVFLLEEINQATVLGMQGLPQKMLFLFLQGKYWATETQPSFPVCGIPNPVSDK